MNNFYHFNKSGLILDFVNIPYKIGTFYKNHKVSVSQFSHSVMSDSLSPHGLQHTRPPCLSPTPGVIHTCVHWVSDAIQPSHPLSYPSPPAFSLSQHQDLFQWLSSLHQVTKVLEFQLQHQSFPWIFRTDFFRKDWLDLLAVQGTLKSLLQHRSSKASLLQRSAFFMVQLSHPYVTTGKNHSFDYMDICQWSNVSTF